ncbi:Holliday junction resolvase [Candidatus Woesearchaeota archaeon]|nr:Holliday junction resolvase [Candidatus Woesearchaeota archaeon]
MSRKSKGIDAERELVHKFNNNGWMAVRIAGSGSMKYPSPDILAGNNIKKIAIECKTTKSNNKYLTRKEVNELRQFANIFGVEPWVAVKFTNKDNKNKDWIFLTLEDLKETDKSFVFEYEKAKLLGLSFEELIGV